MLAGARELGPRCPRCWVRPGAFFGSCLCPEPRPFGAALVEGVRTVAHRVTARLAHLPALPVLHRRPAIPHRAGPLAFS